MHSVIKWYGIRDTVIASWSIVSIVEGSKFVAGLKVPTNKMSLKTKKDTLAMKDQWLPKNYKKNAEINIPNCCVLYSHFDVAYYLCIYQSGIF